MTTAGRQVGGLSPQHPPAPASEQLGTDGNSSGRPQAAIKKLQKPRGHRSPGQPVAEQAFASTLASPARRTAAPRGIPLARPPVEEGQPSSPHRLPRAQPVQHPGHRAAGPAPLRGRNEPPPGPEPPPTPQPLLQSHPTLHTPTPQTRALPPPRAAGGAPWPPRLSACNRSTGPRRPSALCARTAPASTADACSLG